MNRVLVDSNVLLDVISDDPRWGRWSTDVLERLAEESLLVINAVIYAEVSVRFDAVEAVEHALPDTVIGREDIPYDAAFLAGRAYVQYRNHGGERRSPLPDFLIGAHAAVRGYRLLTRDATRYRSYFPTVELIAPA